MNEAEPDYSPIGRPPLFNAERAERVIDAVRRGLTYKLAAAYAGISYSTLNRWRIIGRNGTGSEEFCEFWNALEQANGEAALRLVENIQGAAEEGDWKAASWLLERRHREEWGRDANPQRDPTETLFEMI